MSPVRVFILATQALFAQGVQSLLAEQAGIQVVGVATLGSDALDQMRAAAPDVVIVEATGKELHHLITQALESLPHSRVISLSLEDNLIHTYYQSSKQGQRVEDLVEAIRGSPQWESRSPESLRLFVLFQGHYGLRILENIRRFAPKTWTIQAWSAPQTLPPVIDEPTAFLPPHLPPADLVLSLGESPSVAQLLTTIVERTGAQAAIAPIDNADWLPDGLARQLNSQLTMMGVTAIFPKPFCSLTENAYNVRHQEIAFQDPWISEFARHFGRPAFLIACDDRVITKAEVKRDTACGCARDVARQLIGVGIENAVIQAGLLQHHYPCLATMKIDPGLEEPLIHVSGNLMRKAIEVEIAPHLLQKTLNRSA